MLYFETLKDYLLEKTISILKKLNEINVVKCVDHHINKMSENVNFCLKFVYKLYFLTMHDS